MARLPHFRVLTEVNHTVNVETRCARRYFADSHRIVTKYVIDVHWSTTQKHADSASQLSWQVARRYSHFRANHLALQAMFSKLTLPKLPPKRLHTNSTPDPSLVAARMVALDAYLKQLLSIPVVCCCTQLLTFLGAHHGMNPYAFIAPPPAVRSVRNRFRRKSGTQITGVWDSLSLISSVPVEELRGEEEELESISEPVVLSEARSLIESLGLEERVDDFASKFDELAYASRPDMATGMVQRFLNGLEVAGAVEGGTACFDEALWLLRDELEDRLMRRLHAQTFGVLPEEAEEDARLHDKLASLAHLRPEQIGIPADFADTRFNRWDAARAELLELSSCTTPRRKMACVMRFVLQLKQGLVESKNVKSSRDGEAVAFGADELFPVLVFAVLKANPSRLHSNLMYVQRFRSPMGLKSEAGCYFTHVQANAAAAPTCRLCSFPADCSSFRGHSSFLLPGTTHSYWQAAASFLASLANEAESAQHGESGTADGSGWQEQVQEVTRRVSALDNVDAFSCGERQRTASLQSAVGSWDRHVESIISDDTDETGSICLSSKDLSDLLPTENEGAYDANAHDPPASPS